MSASNPTAAPVERGEQGWRLVVEGDALREVADGTRDFVQAHPTCLAGEGNGFRWWAVQLPGAFAEEPADPMDAVHLPGGCPAAFEVGALTDEEGGGTTCLRCLNDEVQRTHDLLREHSVGEYAYPPDQPQALAPVPSEPPRPVALEHAPANGNGYRRAPLSPEERWDALRLAAGVGELADVRDLPTWAAQLEMAAQLANAAGSLL